MEEKKEKKQVSLAVVIILAVVIAFALGYACKMIIDNRTNTLPKEEEKGNKEDKKAQEDQLDEEEKKQKSDEEKIPKLIGSKTLTSKEFNKIEEYTNKEYIISDLSCKITINGENPEEYDFTVNFDGKKEYKYVAYKLVLNVFNNYFLIQEEKGWTDQFIMYFYDRDSLEEKYIINSFDSKITNSKLELEDSNEVKVRLASIKSNEITFEVEYAVEAVSAGGNSVKDISKYCTEGDSAVLINYSLTEKDGVFSITEKEHKCLNYD